MFKIGDVVKVERNGGRFPLLHDATDPGSFFAKSGLGQLYYLYEGDKNPTIAQKGEQGVVLYYNDAIDRRKVVVGIKNKIVVIELAYLQLVDHNKNFEYKIKHLFDNLKIKYD